MGETKSRGPTTCAVCRDKRPCVFRNGRSCRVLIESYELSGDCNFAKERLEDIAYNTLQRRRKR